MPDSCTPQLFALDAPTASPPPSPFVVLPTPSTQQSYQPPSHPTTNPYLLSFLSSLHSLSYTLSLLLLLLIHSYIISSPSHLPLASISPFSSTSSSIPPPPSNPAPISCLNIPFISLSSSHFPYNVKHLYLCLPPSIPPLSLFPSYILTKYTHASPLPSAPPTHALFHPHRFEPRV